MPDLSYRAQIEEITDLSRSLHFSRPLSICLSHDSDQQVWICTSPDIGDHILGQGKTETRAKRDFIRDIFQAWDAGELRHVATEAILL